MVTRHLVLPLLVLFCAGCSALTDRISVEVSVDEVAGRFIRGVETLDADLIASTFDADAVVFQPLGPPQRFDGLADISAAFHALFDDGRAEGQTQTVLPRRKNLQVFGNTAVLTFELGGEASGSPNPATGRFGRRTVVLHHFEEGWRIVHLHASNVQITAEPQ